MVMRSILMSQIAYHQHNADLYAALFNNVPTALQDEVQEFCEFHVVERNKLIKKLEELPDLSNIPDKIEESHISALETK